MEIKANETFTLKDKIITTATLKLLKHFRGLEQAGMLTKAQASSLIGCVKKLSAIAKDEKLPELEEESK